MSNAETPSHAPRRRPRIAPLVAAVGLSLMATALPAASEEFAFEGEATGSLSITPAKGGVLLRVTLNGLPASTWVAMHVHENPVCDTAGGHEAAGGHFNPANVTHGWLSETGPHAGDLPNLRVDATGTAEAEVFTPLLTAEAGDASIRGRSVIIHEKADDYKSQPSGDAGRRLACAIVPAP
ncbi:superoxide dismutase family protein [Falsigemmobacter intermedius]|uniref:superoxide dismutase family protein n=1 Tax=Falsigemmobacter intermedius TaxID=1553448 RepID=UPI003F0C851A